MKNAYIIFNKITWLDLICIYDPLSRLQSMGYLPKLPLREMGRPGCPERDQKENGLPGLMFKHYSHLY